jgi:DnaJ-domain-containing protein 1
MRRIDTQKVEPQLEPRTKGEWMKHPNSLPGQSHDRQICRGLRAKRIPARCPHCGQVGYTYRPLEAETADWFSWCYMCGLHLKEDPRPKEPQHRNQGPTMDPYAVLGIPPGATPHQIKRAYRGLAKEHHPDVNPGDALAAYRFRRLAEAKEQLLERP